MKKKCLRVLIVTGVLLMTPVYSFSALSINDNFYNASPYDGVVSIIFEDVQNWERTGQGAVQKRTGYYVLHILSAGGDGLMGQVGMYRTALWHCPTMPINIYPQNNVGCVPVSQKVAFSSFHAASAWGTSMLFSFLEDPRKVGDIFSGSSDGSNPWIDDATDHVSNLDSTREQLNGLIGLTLALIFMVGWRVFV